MDQSLQDALRNALSNGQRLSLDPDTEQKVKEVMTDKIMQTDNLPFINNVYRAGLNDRSAAEPGRNYMNADDILRTEKTLDNYNNINDAMKRLITELGLTAKD